MTRNRGQRRRRLIIASILVLLAATVLPAALRADLSPGSSDTSGRTSLTGRFLVAVPSMPAPFAHAVVLMVKHSRDGALGLVINQPLDERPIASLLATLGADAAGTTGKVRIFRGGPVESDFGFALHSPDYRRPETLDIDSHVALSDAASVLRDIGLGKGPGKWLIAFGYAGWAPDQLESELARGAWLTTAGDPALLFDDDRSKVWADALALSKSDR